MNFSLSALTLCRSVSLSPFFSLPVHQPFLSISQRHCYFSHFFNSVISSSSRNSISLTSSTFSHILNSAIFTSSDYAYADAEFNRQHLGLLHGIINIQSCTILFCTADTGGGICSHDCAVHIRLSLFKFNHARIAGALYHGRSRHFSSYGNTLFSNRADYDGAGTLDVAVEGESADLNATNFTLNVARLWSGAWRVDGVGGRLSHSVFDSNSGSVNGAFFDFSWKPALREVSHCLFRNNSAQARGGAFCAFHLQHRSKFERVAFVGNRCAQGPKSISIESVDAIIWLADVYFDGKEKEELGMRFGESEFVKLADVKFEGTAQEMEAAAEAIRSRHLNAMKQ
jgi:hypothetical protein